VAWLGLTDARERRFSLRGIGHDRLNRRRHDDGPDYVLTRGSLMFETRVTPDGRPQMLLGFDHGWPDQRSLTFQAIPGGGISMVQVQGEHIAHAAVQHQVSARTDVLRITFSWDVSRRWAQMTVERPEEDLTTTVEVAHVRPIALQDLRDMLMGRGGRTFAHDVLFAALSDQIEPVGPQPGLGADAMVATPYGYRSVDTLQRGDTVIDRQGAVVPVLHKVDRCVPARGSFAPIRLRAPYFGLAEDAIVAPDQQIVIDGPEVEYLFSQEAVLTPARHLVNGFAARAEEAGPTYRYVQLILPGHEALNVAGTAMESLYIGRIRRKASHLQHSVLRGIDRNELPEHSRASLKVLKWFEAIHLARQRAA
jgi:hypothetical protein